MWASLRAALGNGAYKSMGNIVSTAKQNGSCMNDRLILHKTTMNGAHTNSSPSAIQRGDTSGDPCHHRGIAPPRIRITVASRVQRQRQTTQTIQPPTLRPCTICCSRFFFFRISSSHTINSVCWSHALVNGPTSKRPASDGGRCSGQLLMM